MSRIGRKLRGFITNALDLPKDVTFDLPRITMIGNMQLYVENHRGVRSFTSEKLSLGLSVGYLEITGESLVIRAIHTDEVFIEGVIGDIKYVAEEPAS